MRGNLIFGEIGIFLLTVGAEKFSGLTSKFWAKGWNCCKRVLKSKVGPKFKELSTHYIK